MRFFDQQWLILPLFVTLIGYVFNSSSNQPALSSHHCGGSKNLSGRPETSNLSRCRAAAGQISCFQNTQIKYLLIT